MNDIVSGHEEISTAKTLATAHRDAIKPCVEAVANAYKRLQAAGEITQALIAWGDFCLAMEYLAEEAANLAKRQRVWLADTMNELGCASLKSEAGTWSFRAKPGFVDIVDPAAVPQEFMTTPVPQPNRDAIKHHLKSGASVNWARWIDKPGYTVAFTPKK